ncbi:uncharacterized protein CCOS01_15414 [Colletotrichum costaricense]|uniref:Uncharacterized protein n=1 Tax=Colletotrichum costaricense TaxID=1209916 RepID=A0AAI9YI52_9PEZI|nr:uncharacterized protein CCOS01_15414 [Colletotrichum costaricense]KAI3537898.1 hypothetical protein CSPX01_09891 [Colletotrichum filicis]KAK1510583.1 hypothetical protein CCOS01_15414 [Colletotrichum costaricense]
MKDSANLPLESSRNATCREESSVAMRLAGLLLLQHHGLKKVTRPQSTSRRRRPPLTNKVAFLFFFLLFPGDQRVNPTRGRPFLASGRCPKSERLPDLYASGWHTPIAFADGRRLQFQESISWSRGPSAGRRRGRGEQSSCDGDLGRSWLFEAVRGHTCGLWRKAGGTFAQIVGKVRQA